MGLEIERKFLVNGNFKELAVKNFKIMQGFLSTVPERTVRVRIINEKGFLTIKGIGNKSGISRFEWEKQINFNEAQSLMAICEPGIIDKTRFIIPLTNNLFFEVDEFYGENEGLIVAEIELQSEDQIFEKPSWLGKEVTGNINYYNSSLIKKPFKTW